MDCDDVVQYQMRTNTLTDDDFIRKLPDLVKISNLSPQQRNVLDIYNQYTELLDELHRKKWELERDKISASAKQLQIDSFQRQINALYYERKCFVEEQSVIIKELLAISRFRYEEEERKKLDEWRKTRYSTTKNRQSVASEQPNSTTPTIAESQNSSKNQFSDLLSSVGCIVYYAVLLLIATIPIAMIGLPFWIDLILLGIMLFIPATSSIFWVWGLITTILGPQDILAIIYYILFVIIFLPFFIKLIKK